MDSHQGQRFFRFERLTDSAAYKRNSFILWPQPTKSVNCKLAVASGQFRVSDVFDNLKFQVRRG